MVALRFAWRHRWRKGFRWLVGYTTGWWVSDISKIPVGRIGRIHRKEATKK